jgi:hypothetical protein
MRPECRPSGPISLFWEHPGLPKGVAQISICRIADFQSADFGLEVSSEWIGYRVMNHSRATPAVANNRSTASNAASILKYSRGVVVKGNGY